MRLFLWMTLLFLTACASAPAPVALDCPVVTLPPPPTIFLATPNTKTAPADVVRWWVAQGVAWKQDDKAIRTQVANSH